MESQVKEPNNRVHGTVLILAMIFLVVFASLAVALTSFTDANTQVASNQVKTNECLSAAQSGLEVAKYIVNTVSLEETGDNTVSAAEADQVWTDLHNYMLTLNLSGASVGASTTFSDTTGSGEEILINGFSLPQSNTTYHIRFFRYTSDPSLLKVQSIGQNGGIQRSVHIDMKITKSSEVLKYAIASRGRMWLTGDTTIHGDIFSTWNRAEISPFNMTSDSRVEGTINTVLSRSDIEAQGYEMETLDDNGDPIDASGNPLTTNYADRYASSTDQIQGYHEGINYDQPYQDMPGMDVSDYDTSAYYNRTVDNTIDIPTTTTTSTQWVNTGSWRHPNWVQQEVTTTGPNTVTEYFPNGPGGYDDYQPGAVTLTRYVYTNQTFTDAFLPSNRNALFDHCTFDGVLYVDCSQSTSGSYNNVRFNDCSFNGVIVTNTPNAFKWQYNALYFTGAATFDNQSDIQEATILAPEFNVNLGNTNPQASDNNILKGAIVGGIVDVRGNAQIQGTIISMCDTSQWSSGYVTNIGATLDDGGSETTSIDDIGTISIEPQTEQLLPSGITTPIIIKPENSTYSEGL